MSVELINWEEEGVIKKRLQLELKCQRCGMRFWSHVVLFDCPVCYFIMKTYDDEIDPHDIMLDVVGYDLIDIQYEDMNTWTFNLNKSLLYWLGRQIGKMYAYGDVGHNAFYRTIKMHVLLETFEQELRSVKNIRHGIWLVITAGQFNLMPFGRGGITLDCDSTIESLKKMDTRGINLVVDITDMPIYDEEMNEND